MKKRKMKIYEIPPYYKFTRVRNNFNMMKGYAYFLEDNLTDEQKTELMNRYNNIEFFKSRSEYAPEQIKQVIVVYDKVIKIA